ncbi:hypothetical protein C7S13_0633 [Burkholderia cepacia]|nr:hypothetical protein [Burkholderia cepacia]
MNLDPALIKQLVPGTLNRSTINEQPAQASQSASRRQTTKCVGAE